MKKLFQECPLCKRTSWVLSDISVLWQGEITETASRAGWSSWQSKEQRGAQLVAVFISLLGPRFSPFQ